MLVDDGLLERSNGSWIVTGDLSNLRIPPTIHALLTARLDRLEAEERAVIERASVIGRVFWWGAVAELSPDEQRPRVGSHLQALTRKAADRSAPLDTGRGGRVSLRAHPCGRRGLWRDPQGCACGAARAVCGVGRAEDAGTGSESERRSSASTSNARTRRCPNSADGASAPSRSGAEQPRHLHRQGAGLSRAATCPRRSTSSPERSASPPMTIRCGSRSFLSSRSHYSRPATLRGCKRSSPRRPRLRTVEAEARLEAQAVILGLWVRLFTDPEGWAQEAQREATRAISIFERESDERGLAKAWSLLGLVPPDDMPVPRCRRGVGARGGARGRGRRRARTLRSARVGAADRVGRSDAGRRGHRPLPLDRRPVRRRPQGAVDRARHVGRLRGDARPLRRGAGADRARARDTGGDRATRVARRSVQPARTDGRSCWQATRRRPSGSCVRRSRLCARSASWRGSRRSRGCSPRPSGYRGASTRARSCSEWGGTAGSEDAYSQALLRSVRSKIRARQGRSDEAERLAREAVETATGTDFLFLQWFTLTSLGEVLEVAGRGDEAQSALAQAVEVAGAQGFRNGSAASERGARGRTPRTPVLALASPW